MLRQRLYEWQAAGVVAVQWAGARGRERVRAASAAVRGHGTAAEWPRPPHIRTATARKPLYFALPLSIPRATLPQQRSASSASASAGGSAERQPLWPAWVARIAAFMRQCEGAYSFVALTRDAVYGVRDPAGERDAAAAVACTRVVCCSASLRLAFSHSYC